MIHARVDFGSSIDVGLVASVSGAPLEFSTVTGPGGAPLVVVQTGNKQGPAIVFIHGYSQSYLSWEEQLNDPALQKRLPSHCLRSARARRIGQAIGGQRLWLGGLEWLCGCGHLTYSALVPSAHQSSMPPNRAKEMETSSLTAGIGADGV